MTAQTRRRGITPSVYAEVLSAGRCAYCGITEPDCLEVDHIVPWSRGGSDDRENLTAACWRCNQEKADQTPQEWAAKRAHGGSPWPIPSPHDFAVAIVSHLSSDLASTPWSDAVCEAAHGAYVRSREAEYDAEAEADRLAILLAPPAVSP